MYKIVCGGGDWNTRLKKTEEGGLACNIHGDIRCCAVCPTQEGCLHKCGIAGNKYDEPTDPRTFCDFFAIIKEEDGKYETHNTKIGI